VAPKSTILKAALLTLLSLTGTPSYTTTKDCLTTRVGLVEGYTDTSRFLLIDGASVFPCEAGPPANDSRAQSGLIGSNSSSSNRLMAFIASGPVLVCIASSSSLCVVPVDCVLARPSQTGSGSSLRS
jgi:hypothetical protein